MMGSSRFFRKLGKALYNRLNIVSTVDYRPILLGKERKKFIIRATDWYRPSCFSRISFYSGSW